MRPIQVLSDCSACGVASAAVQLVDPDGGLPHPIESRCRLCGLETALGDLVRAGAARDDRAAILAGLRAWALAEGEADVEQFARTNFGGLSAEAIVERVAAGAPVDTNFDVIAWLFPGMVDAGGGRATAREAERLGVTMRAPPPAVVEPEPEVARAADPADITRALWSVVLADAVADPREVHVADAWCSKLGAPPLSVLDAAARVWRPQELGPIADAPTVFTAMQRVAAASGSVDASEHRVLREYARHWRLAVPDAPPPPPPGLARAWYELGRLLVR